MLFISPEMDTASIASTMQSLEQRYNETNNPVYAMYAFRHCFQRRTTPPTWVMQFVAVAFHDYFEHCGEQSLDKCFQMKAGRGQTPPIKQFLLDERDDLIMRDMFKLVECIGLSMEVAAHMVSEKFAASDWNKTRIELDELSEGSIRDMYRKGPRKQIAEQLGTGLSAYIDDFNREHRISFLATFPAYTVPAGLK